MLHGGTVVVRGTSCTASRRVSYGLRSAYIPSNTNCETSRARARLCVLTLICVCTRDTQTSSRHRPAFIHCSLAVPLLCTWRFFSAIDIFNMIFVVVVVVVVLCPRLAFHFQMNVCNFHHSHMHGGDFANRRIHSTDKIYMKNEKCNLPHAF